MARWMATTARGLLGLALVARPESVLSRAGVDDADETTVLAARFLGGRHLAETVALVAVRGPRTPSVVAAVDVLHATSMVALARLSPRHRRAATGSAATASVMAVSAFVTRGRGPSAGHSS